jgi:hypothetical protein
MKPIKPVLIVLFLTSLIGLQACKEDTDSDLGKVENDLDDTDYESVDLENFEVTDELAMDLAKAHFLKNTDYCYGYDWNTVKVGVFPAYDVEGKHKRYYAAVYTGPGEFPSLEEIRESVNEAYAYKDEYSDYQKRGVNPPEKLARKYQAYQGRDPQTGELWYRYVAIGTELEMPVTHCGAAPCLPPVISKEWFGRDKIREEYGESDLELAGYGYDSRLDMFIKFRGEKLTYYYCVDVRFGLLLTEDEVPNYLEDYKELTKTGKTKRRDSWIEAFGDLEEFHTAYD